MVNTSLIGTYDSYFIGTFDHKPDYFATLSPQVSYNHTVGPTNLKAYVGMAFNRYDINSRFNSDDLSAGISSNFPVVDGSRLSGNVAATYGESTQIDQIVNDRVATKSYQVDVNASYRTGIKTSLSDTVAYIESQRKLYGNQTIGSNQINFGYTDFLENTNLNLSETYTRTKSAAGNYANYLNYVPERDGNIPDVAIDQTANSFNVGVAHPIYGQIIGEVVYGYMIMHRSAAETNSGVTDSKGSTIAVNITGPLLPPARFPKVESSATISYQQAASQGINDAGSKTIVGNANLAWNARERTRVSLSASRAQSLGTSNFSVVTTSVTTGVTENIGLATTLTGSVIYTWRDYRGITRHDSVLEADLSLQHALTRHWNIGTSYTFQDNATSTPATRFVAARYALDSYVRHVVTVSLGCAY
jgi:hypothetical protein